MPPCNCHPPFPRPEPFSPLPRPGRVPDWGKWIRDRLAEKGALLVFPTRASFPDPGAQPNVYEALDTGTLYRWDGAHYQVLVDPSAANDVLEYEDRGRFPETGEHGKLYIAANTGDLYRWGGEGYVALLPGKADRAVPQAAGNFAGLDEHGNLADSGKKPSDFADAENTYTKAETDEAIDRVAAYYITRNAAGDAFETKAQLNSATVFYSGGKVRTPTRNDYCVVLADETHDNAEYRYIYAVADGETTGSWQPQFPVEGVMTIDQSVTRNSQNPVSGGGVWSAIWGALTSLPSGFSSLYDWVVGRLGLKRDYTDLSYDTTETVEVPALHATMTNQQSGQVIVEYDLLCAEEVPDPPQIGHVYTWRADGAAFYVTQGVSVYQTRWTLYSYAGDELGGVTTQNATQGFYPDVEFRPSNAVITIHKTTVQKQVTTEDKLALESKTVPTSRTVNGTPLSSDVTLTGADIAVSGTDATKINAALAGKATKADATLTPIYSDTPTFSDWTFTDVSDGITDIQQPVFDPPGEPDWSVRFSYDSAPRRATISPSAEDSTKLVFEYTDEGLNLHLTATRTRTDIVGYQLGPQTDKPLASEAEAAANRVAISTLNDTKADKSDMNPLLFAQYYPEGNVKSAAEFTQGIKYDAPDTTNRTITVKPFCNTGDSKNDNSGLVGRVVIPPFVDASGNGYISDDGTRFKVVGVGDDAPNNDNQNLTAIIVPTTVTSIGYYAFSSCTALSSILLPASTTIKANAFQCCISLTSVSLPTATSIGLEAFSFCTSLSSVDFGDTPRSSVPTLGTDAFSSVPTTCKIVVPYTQYDAWIAADGWKDLPQEFVRHAEKADKPATFTSGNLAALDANGNPTDSGIAPGDKLDATSAAPAFSTSSTYAVGDHVTYNGALYRCTTAVSTAGAWTGDTNWTADTMTDPDAVLDVTAQNQLRVVAKDGTLLWLQGYDLASTSSATLACDAVNNFTFADGATTQAFALPTAPTGKVGDFGLDIDNSANTGAATLTLTGLDTTFSVVVPEGESLTDMLAIAAGELARFYVTLTTFRVNNLPTWHIVKQVVENGGAQS